MKGSVPRHILFGFLSFALPLISTVIVLPFVVRGLGAEEYGLYALALGFINYSFAFGLGRGVTKYVAEYQAAGDARGVQEILAATVVISLLVGIGGTLIFLCATRPFVTDVLLINAAQENKAVTAFYLAAATVVLIVLHPVFSGALQGLGRFDWYSHITTIFSTLLSVGNLILVEFGGETIILLWWNLILVIATVATLGLATKRAMPNLPLTLRFSKKNWRRAAGFSGAVIAHQVAVNFWLLFERSWITRYFGTENLTYYLVPMTIATLIVGLMMSFSLALMPLASAVAAQQEQDRLRSIYQRATKYVALLVVFICLSLSIGGKAFFALWLSANFADRAGSIFIWHILTWGMISFGLVTWHINDGLGFPWRNASLAVLWAISGIGLLVILSPRFGLEGAAAARTIALFATYPIFMLAMERLIFDRVFWKFWLTNLLALSLAGASAGAIEYVLLKNLLLSWATLTLAVAASGLVFFGALFLIRFFTPVELEWLKSFASRAINSANN